MGMTLGNKINALMTERHLTGKKLAYNINMTEGTISKILTGMNTNPKSDTIIALAKYFNVSTDYLLGVSDIKNVEDDYISQKLGLNSISIARLKHLAEQEPIIFPKNGSVSLEEPNSFFFGTDFDDEAATIGEYKLYFSIIDYINRLIEQVTDVLSFSFGGKLTGIKDLISITQKLDNVYSAYCEAIQTDDNAMMLLTASVLSNTLNEFEEVKETVRQNCTCTPLFVNEVQVFEGIKKSIQDFFSVAAYNELLDKYKHIFNSEDKEVNPHGNNKKTE